MIELYGLVGLGGFGREVAPLAQTLLANQIQNKSAEFVFVTDLKTDALMINGVRLISLEEYLSHPGAKYFNIAVADPGSACFWQRNAPNAGRCRLAYLRPRPGC